MKFNSTSDESMMSNSEPRLLHRTIPLTHLIVLGISYTVYEYKFNDK